MLGLDAGGRRFKPRVGRFGGALAWGLGDG